MTATELKNATGFDVAWAERAASLAAARGEPDWAAERRRSGAHVMRSLSFPDPKHELWRRTDFSALQEMLPKLDPFAAAPAHAGTTFRDTFPDLAKDDRVAPALLVQHNAEFAVESVPEAFAMQGIVVCSLERVMRDHADLLRSHFGSLLLNDYDWYVALGAALRTGGAFVWVPDGVEANGPIRLLETLDGGALAAPRTVIVLGRGAQATVIAEQRSATTDRPAFQVGGTEVFVGDGARLTYATLQDWGRNVYQYTNHRARVGRDANLQWVQTVLGAAVAKAHAWFDLAGSGARADVHGFMFGDTRQHFHLHTLQRHLVDHTTSDLLIKCCLEDRARSVYQGLIQVSEGAQRTDAYQANRNLLLSETARADSIPGLEILANDVRCTHGATVGTLDPEQLYYLMSRGLSRPEAQRLIVEGFFAPVLDRIPLAGVREELERAIERKIR